jgi:hypothetical protein
MKPLIEAGEITIRKTHNAQVAFIAGSREKERSGKNVHGEESI